MKGKFSESILNRPIASLNCGDEFKCICELSGFHSLADLLERHTSELLKYPGFTYHILAEYINFLEAEKLAHYIDAG